MDIQLYSAILGAFVGSILTIVGSFGQYYASKWQQKGQRNKELMANLKREFINIWQDIYDNECIINNRSFIDDSHNVPRLSKLQYHFLEDLLKNGFPKKWSKTDRNRIIDTYNLIRDVNKNIEHINTLSSTETSNIKSNIINYGIQAYFDALDDLLVKLSTSDLDGIGRFEIDLIEDMERENALLGDKIKSLKIAEREKNNFKKSSN